MKIGLRVKFAAFFLIFGCGLVAALSALISNFTETSFMNRYADNLLRLIQVAEGVLDLTPEEIRRYGETGQEDDRYRELQDVYKRQIWNDGLQNIIPETPGLRLHIQKN